MFVQQLLHHLSSNLKSKEKEGGRSDKYYPQDCSVEWYVCLGTLKHIPMALANDIHVIQHPIQTHQSTKHS